MFNIRENMQINPTFKEGEVVILTKDCDYYSEIASEDHSFGIHFRYIP